MKSVLDYFEQTCMKFENKTALIEEEQSITYLSLLEKSKALGSHISQYVSNNEPVVVFMPKGINAVISFLGVLYGGGCYCLVNPDFPEERIRHIKEILDCHCVLTVDDTYDQANHIFNDCYIVNVSQFEGDIDHLRLEKIKRHKIDIDPVYINFTSGSTGIPKGVVVSHRSIIDFINEFTQLFHITNLDIIANQAPFDFDVSVKDLYSSFFTGATLLIIPKEYFSAPVKLLDYLSDYHATVMIWAVSALCLVTTFHGLDYKVPIDVKKIIFSGEVMPLKHLNIWRQHLPNAMFVNVYGPTEITCNCTYHIVEDKEYHEALPIGIPFNNERVFLLDEKQHIINNPDQIGEICVSGTCLSLGYYRNPSQNTQYFTTHPANDCYYERIYRTGDYGRYNKDGEFVFCGRKDFQVKHMGHRIELEEIDQEIMKINGVIRTCVIYDELKSKLYGFYIGEIDEKELRRTLMERLPIYMVPNKMVKLDVFPLTKNGKTDRRQLLNDFKEKRNERTRTH